MPPEPPDINQNQAWQLGIEKALAAKPGGKSEVIIEPNGRMIIKYHDYRNIEMLEKILAFIFGVVFVLVSLGIVIVVPNPTAFQYTVCRIVLALAAAGVAAVIPGILKVKVGKFVRAGGAIAVFVIVYFYSPASLVVNPAEGQTTKAATPNT